MRVITKSDRSPTQMANDVRLWRFLYCYHECNVWQTMEVPVIWYHDDVIEWKHFPRYLPFVLWNSPVTDEFPAQMASEAENVSSLWRHHVQTVSEMPYTLINALLLYILDFKAFNTLDHDIFVFFFPLNHWGIRGIALANRKPYVLHNDNPLYIRLMIYGVLKG